MMTVKIIIDILDVTCVSQADAGPQEDGARPNRSHRAAPTHTVCLQWITGAGDCFFFL